MRRKRMRLVVATLALATTACAGGPRQRPLPTKPIDTGENTTNAVRKQLEGRWVLVAYRATTPDGKSLDIDADGHLLFDGFGTLQIEYKISDVGMQTLSTLGIRSPNPTISTNGRVVIDTHKHLITYASDDFTTKLLAADPELARRRSNPYALERVRTYAFDSDGLLTLTTHYDDGKEALMSRWKRAS
ncbi:MAG TPA: hypothetical protein VGF24_13780 [Vicinamibacterales bacterium]